MTARSPLAGDRLAGRVALIVGGGTTGDYPGTGSATAQLFAAQGAKLVVMGRTPEHTERTVADIEAAGGSAVAVLGDIGRGDDCSAAVDAAVHQFGGVDILVNNVAVHKHVSLEQFDEETWHDIIDGNVTAIARMTSFALPHLRRTGHGSIINIGSVAGVQATGVVGYGTAKAAVEPLTRDLAVALGKDGIRVNCVIPGHLHTPHVERVRGRRRRHARPAQPAQRPRHRRRRMGRRLGDAVLRRRRIVVHHRSVIDRRRRGDLRAGRHPGHADHDSTGRVMMLSVDEIESAAVAAAGGLDDFGPDDHRPGLAVLIEAAATSPHAGAALDERVRHTAVDALASRLTSQHGWASRPNCCAAVATATGGDRATEIGHDGAPPDPRRGSGSSVDTRVAGAETTSTAAPISVEERSRPYSRRRQLRSGWPDALHDVTPDDPEECLMLMRQSFVNMLWVSSLAVPSYHEWFVEQDERPSYRRYADNLRLLGADDPDRTWLLKNPSHTFGLSAMFAEFPEAVFVHIYRDPAETIVSGCSLIASIGLGEGTFTPAELGAHRLRIWAMAAERMEAAKNAPADRIVIDVDYRRFVRDPIGTVADIYQTLERAFTGDAEAAMHQWMSERPKDRHGAHRYSAHDFGLTDSGIRERMAGYVDRYGTSEVTGGHTQ